MHPAIFATGLAIASFSVLGFLVKRARYRRWIRTTGTIVSLVEHEDRDGGASTFAPRIKFQTATNDGIVFVSPAESFPKPRVGDPVAVLHDPSDPQDATLDAFIFKHLPETIFFFIGFATIMLFVFR